MFVTDFLADRLREQIALAPELSPNTVPGGTVAEMIAKTQEAIQHANHTARSPGTQSGGWRYARIMTNILPHLRKLGALFEQVEAGRQRTFRFRDEEREASAALQHDLAPQIVAACEASIALLEQTQQPASAI